MATTAERVVRIRKIVRFKQVMLLWKHVSLQSWIDSPSSSGSRRIPAGFLAVYVGSEHERFLIPTRLLNLPVFVGLLEKAEEEFGIQRNGGLVLPCEVGFFEEVLKLLERDESRFGRLGLEEFMEIVSEVGSDSCKEATSREHRMVSPLLQKAMVI